MLKNSNMIKLFMLIVCALLYNSSIAFSTTIETDVKTDNNGETSEEHIEGIYTPGGSSGTSGSSSSQDLNIPELPGGGDGDGTGTGQEGEEKNECTEKPENCSNLYHNRPLFPVIMMIYCQTSAEKIATDLSLIEECIKKYVKALNNDNSEIRKQGLQDYNELRSQALIDTLTLAGDKLKAVIDYNDAQNDFANAIAKSNTQRDTEASLTHAHSFSTDMINNLRELYVENLKYMALNGIATIDPAAILNKQEYEESRTTVRKSAATNTENSSSSANTTATGDELDNIDEDEDEYEDEDTGEHIWDNDIVGEEEDSSADSEFFGEGENVLPDVPVYGHQTLDDFEKMSPRELSQYQDELAAMRKEAEKTLNDPDATDSEIAGAQKVLDRIAALEKSIGL